MMITSGGILIRTAVDQIRETGRIAQGVTLINLDDGDTLMSASVIKPDLVSDDETVAAAPPPPTENT